MTRPIDADALAAQVIVDAMDEAIIKGLHNANSKKYSRFLALIATAPTIDAEPHWIPCSERLPEDDRSNVVTLANGKAEVGYYSNGDWWCVGDKFTLENPTVIAWMPLPEPYEVKHE